MRNILIITALTLCYMINLSTLAFSAEAAKKAATKPPVRPPVTAPARRAAMPSFSMIMGTLSKVDTSDPAKPRLVVKSDKDGSIHTIEMTPWTNISKITDVSELKPGEAVRVMARKAEDKEIAINVLFGNIKNRPPASPAFRDQSPMQQPVSPTKQEQAKKY